MKIDNNIRIGFVCGLIAFACVIKGAAVNQSAKSFSTGISIAFSAKRKAMAGMVRVDIAERGPQHSLINADSLYTVRINLSSLQPVRDRKLLAYMDNGIQQCFYLTAGTDTITPVACQRIPCISKNDFLYLSFFQRKMLSHTRNWRICIADTLAGFGITAFDVRN